MAVEIAGGSSADQQGERRLQQASEVMAVGRGGWKRHSFHLHTDVKETPKTKPVRCVDVCGRNTPLEV